jgi:drug/metabolite transporter (DMT)-like permease
MIKGIDMELLGETAAVIVALLWTVNSILFWAAGKRIGAVGVNAFRIVLAVILLGITHVILLGTLVPDANSSQWFWMGMSGIVGLGIGDFALFEAFVKIGPRRSLLLMALAPVCSLIAGYFMLNETLRFWSFLGIAVTLLGIVIVVFERKEENKERTYMGGQKLYGIMLGIIGAVGQGVGLVFSKYGMINVADDPSQPLDSLSATLLRMIIGAVFVWICVIAAGRFSEIRKSLSDRHALKLTSGGAFVGPFLGVWFSMIAVTYT